MKKLKKKSKEKEKKERNIANLSNRPKVSAAVLKMQENLRLRDEAAAADAAAAAAEEARIKAEEEAESQRKADEDAKKAAKKEKERLKKEQLRAEGKLLSAKQKEEQKTVHDQISSTLVRLGSTASMETGHPGQQTCESHCMYVYIANRPQAHICSTVSSTEHPKVTGRLFFVN